jgi:hypothetical protein
VEVFFGDGTGLETTPSYQSADSTISNTVAIADLDGSSQMTVTGHSFAGDGVSKIFRLPHQPIEFFDRVEVMGGATPRFTLDREAARVHFSEAPAAGTTVEVDYRHSTNPDVAFSRWVNYATAVYHNAGGGLPATPTWDTGDPSATDRGAAFSDPDGDDDLDLALGNSGDPTVLWRNDGGTLATISWAAADSLFFSAQEMAWGDVDGDGDEDLATIHFGNGHLRVYLNRNGELDTAPSWLYDFSTSATSLAWGDVNGDGFLDLAAGTARDPAVVFLNTSEPATPAPEIDERRSRVLHASPNPFRLETAIRIPASGEGRIEILDAHGRTVRVLEAGRGMRVVWDGRDGSGRRVAAGVYYLRRETSSGLHTGRVVRLR